MYEHALSSISGTRIRKARLVRKAGAFGLVLLLSAFALVYVWQRVQVISMGYELEALKKEKAELMKTNKSLLIEAATLTSPDRIEAIARNNIGMKLPGDSQIVMVKRVARGEGTRADSARHVERSKPGPGKS